MSDATTVHNDQPFVNERAMLQRIGFASALLMLAWLAGQTFLLAFGQPGFAAFGTSSALIVPTRIRYWFLGERVPAGGAGRVRPASEAARSVSQRLSFVEKALLFKPWLRAIGFSWMLAILEQVAEHLFFPHEHHQALDAGIVTFIVGLIVYGIVYRLEANHEYVRSPDAQSLIDAAIAPFNEHRQAKQAESGAELQDWVKKILPALKPLAPAFAHAIIASVLTVAARLIVPKLFGHWEALALVGGIVIILVAAGPRAFSAAFDSVTKGFRPIAADNDDAEV